MWNYLDFQSDFLIVGLTAKEFKSKSQCYTFSLVPCPSLDLWASIFQKMSILSKDSLEVWAPAKLCKYDVTQNSK